MTTKPDGQKNNLMTKYTQMLKIHQITLMHIFNKESALYKEWIKGYLISEALHPNMVFLGRNTVSFLR